MSAAKTLAALERSKFKATEIRHSRKGRTRTARKAYNAKLSDAKGKSGVYAIWVKGRLRYIGESHSGRLYDTITRHFRQWSGPNTSYNRDHAEVAFTTRPRDPEKTQAQLIEHAQPADNIECTGEDNACAAGSTRKTKRNPPEAVSLEVEQLGIVRRIEYVHARDGQTYVHDFGPKKALYAAGDGKALLIHGPGLKVGEFIEG